MGLTTVPGAGVVRRQVVLAAIYNLLKKRLVEMNAPTSGKRTEQTTKKASNAQCSLLVRAQPRSYISL